MPELSPVSSYLFPKQFSNGVASDSFDMYTICRLGGWEGLMYGELARGHERDLIFVSKTSSKGTWGRWAWTSTGGKTLLTIVLMGDFWCLVKLRNVFLLLVKYIFLWYKLLTFFKIAWFSFFPRLVLSGNVGFVYNVINLVLRTRLRMKLNLLYTKSNNW